MNDKGFTLIELLAVIIILGILMIIAIPSVTKYISDSKKNAYISTVKAYVNGTMVRINRGDFDAYDTDTLYYIPYSCIKLENEGNSPYGDFDKAYTIVKYNGESYDYSWVGTDTAKMGIKDITSSNDLNISLIKANVKNEDLDFDPGIALVNRFYNSDCSSYEDKTSDSALHNLSFMSKLGSYVEMIPTGSNFRVDRDIDVSKTNLWRVLKKNSDGTLELIADNPSDGFYMPQGNSSYLNYVDMVNGYASHYKNDKYTINTRCPGYNGQTQKIDSNNFVIPSSFFISPSSLSTTDATVDNSNEKIGGGDVMYQQDLDLINNVYGTLKANKPYYVGSRVKRIEHKSIYQWYWDGRIIDYSGNLKSISFITRCSNTCAAGYSGYAGIRPIITMKANLVIESGKGTKAKPFVLE